MNNVFKLTLMVFLFLFFIQEALADDSLGSFSIHVRGFFHDRGQVIANLFRAEGDVMNIKTVYRRVQAKIVEGNAVVVFPDLSYGQYAVSVFHDENGNGDLDHNIFRFPAEPLGFSNGFHLGLFSGLPSFEKLKLTFGPDTSSIEINLK